MLRVEKRILDAMVASALDGYPLEACGLLGGSLDEPGTATVTVCYPADNVAASARLYQVEPRALLRADRAAEAGGGQLIGVFHSHTHTEADPRRPTSPRPPTRTGTTSWSPCETSIPSVRSWRIRDGKITEEPVVLQW